MNVERRFALYRASYAAIWKSLAARPQYLRTIDATAEWIISNRARYEAIEKACGVPWYFVGIVHKMEGDGSFSTHLHNGDPLTARTKLVPAGRPVSGRPPFTWEESALDALRMKSLHKVDDWSVERIAFELERFNGFGYRRFGVPSPYLWSFSTAYTCGKYVRDGVWSATAVSKQSGGMVLLQAVDRKLGLRLRCGEFETAHPDEGERPVHTPGVFKPLLFARTILGAAMAAVGYVITKLGDLLGLGDGGIAKLAADVATESGSFAAPLTQLAAMIGASLPWIGAAAFMYGIGMVLYARIHAHLTGKIG